MSASSLNRIVLIVLVVGLSSCATAPSHINDICAVFDQNDGWMNNWQSAASKAERKYGVPVPVLMATVRKESGFKSNAKPPRTWYLGFIPGKRASSAYGYSQALDGTWAQYKVDSGNFTARRTNFADAVDFVGWYHSRTADTFGVAKNDTFNLYLAYYMGWNGYKRGAWRNDSGLQSYARATDDMARKYAAQLGSCR